MSKLKRAASAVVSVFEMIGRKKVAVYAAASDYFISISLVPILMLLVSLVRYLPFEQADVMRVFADTVPVSVYSVIDTIVSSIYESGSGVITVSVLLTLFSASSAMRSIMKGLDAVYEVERRENVVLFFLRACAYMLIFVLMIALSLTVMVYGSVIVHLLRDRLPSGGFVYRLLGATKQLRFTFAMALLTLSFLLLYRWVPSGRRSSKGQWPGAIFSAISWAAFSWVFSLYVSISDQFGAYGYIGSIMVAMMWLYFCLMFLLIGGCINAWLEQRSAARTEGAAEEDE